MVVDYHTHSNYSDGDMLWRMLRAADDAGLDGIGFADHCNVSTDPRMQSYKRRNGFNLDMTCERRREAIRALRDRFDVTVFDAVEIDVHPDDVPEIEAFLNDAGFDYVVGSVHHVEVDGERRHIMAPRHFDDLTDAERQDVIDTYVDHLVAMIDAGIVDIVAHMDVFERNTALRGQAKDRHYARIADAVAGADCVPEINAGRVLGAYGEIHPRPSLLAMLRERDVRFTLGSDAHAPDELVERTNFLREFIVENDISPVQIR